MVAYVKAVSGGSWQGPGLKTLVYYKKKTSRKSDPHLSVGSKVDGYSGVAQPFDF